MTESRVVPDGDALERAIEAAREKRPIGSPCIGVCRLDAHRRFCEGCLRALDEITAWRAMSDDDKLRVLDGLGARRLADAPQDRISSASPLRMPSVE